MLDIDLTIRGVQNLLSKIEVNKSTGPDEHSPRILIEVSHKIAPNVHLQFVAKSSNILFTSVYVDSLIQTKSYLSDNMALDQSTPVKPN